MLLLARGVKRCEKVFSSIFWLWPLIQPWQRASSTASFKLRAVGWVVPFLARVGVTPGEVVLWVASQVDQEVALGRVRVGRSFILDVVAREGGVWFGMGVWSTWMRGIMS